MADMTPDQLAAAIKEGNRELLSALNVKTPGGSSPSFSGGGSIPSGAMWSGLTTVITSATGAFTGLVTGTTNLRTAFDATAGALGNIPVVGNLASKVVGQLGNTALTLNDGLNKIGNSGARMDNDLGLYARSFTGARQSLDQYNDTVRNSSQSLRTLGANYDQSSLIYAATAKRMHEDVDLVYQLQSIGYPIEEFNKILVLSAQSSRNADLTRKSTQDMLIASGAKLANTFDENARLTGISVDKQREALEAQLRKTETDLYMQSLAPEQQAAMRENIALSRLYGDNVARATEIMAMGGPMNEEETRIVASMPPAMQDAVRRLAEVEGVGPEADKKRAAINEEMKAIAMREAADQRGAKQQSALFRTGDEQGKALALSSAQIRLTGETLNKGEARAKEANETWQQYYDKDKAARAERLKATTEGKPAAESAVAVDLNKGQRLMADASAGMGIGISKLNTEAGTAANSLNGLNVVLRKFSAEQFAGIPEKFVAEIKKRAAPTSGRVPSEERASATATIPPVERQDGSFGAVGKFMEDFGKGTPAILHGKEGVITEKQFNNLFGELGKAQQPKEGAGSVKQPGNMFGSISDIGKQVASIMPSEKQLSGVVSGMQSNLSFEIEKNKASMPKMADFQNMMAGMTNAMPASAPSMPEMPAFAGADGAMTDMKDQLMQLNTLMSQLLSHTATMADNTEAQVRATKSLSGNLLS